MLCINFFEGKGYSDEFTQNMEHIINMLESRNPEISVFSSADVICAKCPCNVGGVCKSEEKVQSYDKKVLGLCGLENGTEIKWKEFRNIAFEKIIRCNRLCEVCGDCKWQYICGK